MVAFDRDAEWGDEALALMVNTFVVLFWRMSLLDAKLVWLLGRGYEVARVDASMWTTEADLHRDLAAALNFPRTKARTSVR